MNYGVVGASGRMGSEVINVFNEKKHTLVFAYDIEGVWKNEKPEVLIDCSLPEVFEKSIGYACDFNIPFIIATTGLSQDQLDLLEKHSKQFSVVQSYNFSIGIQVLLKLTDFAKKNLEGWDVEISETHHRFKKDKPSGTAKMIQSLFNEDVNTSSLRLGSVPGDHSVSFGGLGEILTISHRALSRRTFAEGILKSAEFAYKKKNGFYTFTDVVFGRE